MIPEIYTKKLTYIKSGKYSTRKISSYGNYKKTHPITLTNLCNRTSDTESGKTYSLPISLLRVSKVKTIPA